MLQTTVPDRLRGRVFAFFDIVWQTMRMVSIVGGGVAADRFGIRAVYVIGGCLLVAAAALGFGLAGAPDLPTATTDGLSGDDVATTAT